MPLVSRVDNPNDGDGESGARHRRANFLHVCVCRGVVPAAAHILT
jgi:hypothetical protein